VRLLLDTHALIWWLAADQALSSTARDAIADSSNDVFVSAASAWEITTKHRIGKLPEAGLLAADVAGFVSEQDFIELPVTIRHGQLAGSLPGIHKDPFDRILVAQAILADMQIVSRDEILSAYGIARLW
jgi:PIN domain nuclease of toxin-antitoxin system